MKVTAIIPARYASTRFEGKPLADIMGKTMIQHVYERCRETAGIEDVIVATDDERIFKIVRSFGGKAAMTSSDHETGTDRLAEVARMLDSDLIVNVQGDEPMIDPAMIEEVLKPLMEDRTIVMGTLKSRIIDDNELANPSVVKVVVDRNDFALYFSRHAIPYVRDSQDQDGKTEHFKHIGLYVYDRDFLLNFAGMEPTPLEKAEKLEQLRALENGFRIKVATTEHESIGVDRPEDLEKVINVMRSRWRADDGQA